MTVEQTRVLEYDEKAAARILGIAPRTLRAWRIKGLIGHHRTPTGRVRFTLDQLMAVQSAGRVNPKPGTAGGAGGDVTFGRMLPHSAA